MKTLIVSLFALLFMTACSAEVKIVSRPNPLPNVAYSVHNVYETKVLEAPDDPNSELVDAVMIKWLYKLDKPPVYTLVLKDLVTEFKYDKETGEYRNWVEWKSQVHYRDDGVVDNTQVVIHKNR